MNIKKDKIIIIVSVVALFAIFFFIWFFSEEDEPKTLEERVPVVNDVKSDAYQAIDGKIYYRQAGNLREVIGADPETFESIDNNYAKDRTKAYFHNFAIQGAEASTFEVIDEFYCKDALNVFCSDISVYKKEIPEADVFTFEKISGRFYKDKNYIFENCHISELPDLDPETFEVIDDKTVKDKNGTYNLK